MVNREVKRSLPIKFLFFAEELFLIISIIERTISSIVLKVFF